MKSFQERLGSYLSKQKDKIAPKLLDELLRTNLPIKRGVRIYFDFDLRRTQPDKYSLCPEGSNDWIAFLNKRGTLVHVMRYGVPHMLIRLPGFKLEGTSSAYKLKVISERLYEGLV